MKSFTICLIICLSIGLTVSLFLPDCGCNGPLKKLLLKEKLCCKLGCGSVLGSLGLLDAFKGRLPLGGLPAPGLPLGGLKGCGCGGLPLGGLKGCGCGGGPLLEPLPLETLFWA